MSKQKSTSTTTATTIATAARAAATTTARLSKQQQLLFFTHRSTFQKKGQKSQKCQRWQTSPNNIQGWEGFAAMDEQAPQRMLL